MAVDGRGSAVCLEGEAGVGKTTLLDAVADGARKSEPAVDVLRVVGVEAELSLGHAALFDLLTPLLDLAGDLPAAQRAALDSMLGRSAPAPADRFLIAAATLSLLSLHARRRPLVVIVDDLQWIDSDTRSALTFASRRIGDDRVVMLLARRTAMHGDEPADLAAIARLPIAGLSIQDGVRLLDGTVAPAVAGELATRGGGNPLALLESARSLTPEQRRGSAPLPTPLRVGHRLSAVFIDAVQTLSPAARWTVTVAAASFDVEATTIRRAVASTGTDPDSGVREAEGAGIVTAYAGQIRFRHPLVRNAVLHAATSEDRRRAHVALAAATAARPSVRLRHRAEASVGPDDALGRELLRLADSERSRSGYGSASILAERAAALMSAPEASLDAIAAAVEDAVLSGDVVRVRTLAQRIGSEPVEISPQAHARALLCSGELEEVTGSVPDSVDLLNRAVELGTGLVRIRALSELLQAHYRLASATGMRAAADAIAELADRHDPEQDMLVSYSCAAALAYAGDWSGAAAPALRAFELLEGDPSLRDDPRYLVATGLAAVWAGRAESALVIADRRIAATRAKGALGVLPMVLGLVSGGMSLIGRHQEAYAYVGESVELGTEMGYVADVAVAQELLAWQLAARGRPEEARRALDAAWALEARAGVADVAVHVELVEAFCALCVGDTPRVVEILEHRLEVDDGRQPQGDYPLSVVPDLVEAYLALGRRDDAIAVAARHAALYRDSWSPAVRADVAMVDGLLTSDTAAADAAFERAHEDRKEAGEPFLAGRTRLLHGTTLRRAGERIAARKQLRMAEEIFRELGFVAWSARAEHELAATGQTARRGAGRDSTLTSQETRVALQVARGMTNKEIGAALFLSPKTVEHHVTSALRKRSLRSRVELAAAFAAAVASRRRAPGTLNEGICPTRSTGRARDRSLMTTTTSPNRGFGAPFARRAAHDRPRRPRRLG